MKFSFIYAPNINQLCKFMQMFNKYTAIIKQRAAIILGDNFDVVKLQKVLYWAFNKR